MGGDESQGGCGFWSRECGGRTKLWFLSLLLICFGVQTTLVYTDAPGSKPLSADALEGRRLWHAHNCQACHQVYGFGGFLGPDLTNAHARVDRARLEHLLTEGTDVMPAFGFEANEITAIAAYLGALDATGQGQAKAPAVADIRAEYHQAVGSRVSGAAARGFSSYRMRCEGCHAPFSKSAVGAPDLSTVPDRLEPAEIQEVLREGRPPRMPPPGMGESERADVFAFLMWQAGAREELRAAAKGSASDLVLGELPWWEFQR